MGLKLLPGTFLLMSGACALAPSEPENPCVQGSATTCRDRVEALVVEGRVAQAATWLTEGCESGNLDACVDLAIRCRPGGSLPTDAERSISLLTRASGSGSPVAAYELGVTSHRGFGVPVDLDFASHQYQRGCERDYEPACYDLGILLTQGEVPVDGETAGRAFMASCGMGNAAACLNVGSLIEHGLYTPPEPHTIASLKARACELAPEDACD